MSLQPSYPHLHQNYFFSGSSSPPTNSRQNENFFIMSPSESSMSSLSHQDRRYSSDIQDASPPTDDNLSTSDDEHYGELWNITPTLNISKPEVFPILVPAKQPCQTTPVYQKTLQAESGFNYRENCENLKNEVQRIRCFTCSTTATNRWHVDSKGHRICDTCNAICAKGADTSSTIFQQQRNRRKRMNSKRTNVSCSNCEITQTSLWRRNEEGKPICNACGLYYKLHKVNRPLSMKKDVIQVRRRRPKPKRLNEVGDTSTNEDSSSGHTPSPTVSCRFNFPPVIEKTKNNDQKKLEPNANNHLKMYETNFTYNQEAFLPINNNNFPLVIQRAEMNNVKMSEPNANSRLETYENIFECNREAFQPINNFPPMIERTEINNEKMPEPNTNSRLETYEANFTYNQEAYQPINNNFPPEIQRTEINNMKMPEPNANSRLETYENVFAYNQEAFQPINNFPPMIERTEINNEKMPEPNTNSRLETYETNFTYNQEAYQPINNNNHLGIHEAAHSSQSEILLPVSGNPVAQIPCPKYEYSDDIWKFLKSIEDTEHLGMPGYVIATNHSEMQQDTNLNNVLINSYNNEMNSIWNSEFLEANEQSSLTSIHDYQNIDSFEFGFD